MGMSRKNKQSMLELPIQMPPPEKKEGYAPYRKRRCVDGTMKRTVSQNKGLHELNVDIEREKMLRGRSASCPIPLQKLYYAHYLYIDKFEIHEGDDYDLLFI